MRRAGAQARCGRTPAPGGGCGPPCDQQPKNARGNQRMTLGAERPSLFAPGLLAGRTAMVTGASSGLGHHFAKTLGDAGARVVLAARRMDRLEARAQELRRSGAEAVVVEMDVRDSASVRAAVQSVVREAGAIDIPVNNSGIALTKSLLEYTDEDWESVLDTNLS